MLSEQGAGARGGDCRGPAGIEAAWLPRGCRVARGLRVVVTAGRREPGDPGLEVQGNISVWLLDLGSLGLRRGLRLSYILHVL